ncbi:SET and MYND domain-containing protein 4 [Willisornis vidua]|uniref:Protein-lysine N-methyltransferase SMYD4 n=1 Tax=Willisornis vidua TaxID=1566151 RepID=A0ABQ9DBS5_9PASS|nr:SET and MYND domain-containing protein 4 [Willisornis vidua]
MALPVPEWRGFAARRWAALDPALRERLAAASLHDMVRLGCDTLWTEEAEEEAALPRLCRRASTDKAAAAAGALRERGNREFGRGRYRAALGLYCKVCLEDIARAESHGCPDRLLPKVLLRKAECLLCLGRLQDAADALSVVESKIHMDGLMTSPTHQTLLKKLSQLKVKIHKKERCPEPAPEACGDMQGKSEIWEENDSISGASSSVSLNFDTERGRHLVASQNIMPGQRLLKEEAFVSVLCPGESLPLQDSETAWDTRVTNADLYCHRCLRQLLASVPCQGCSYAKYCSQDCADVAWQQYHRTECSLGALLLTLGVFCHVALRTVLLAGFAEVNRLVKWCHSADKDPHNPKARVTCPGEAPDAGAGTRSIPGCNDTGQYQSSYQAVFHLLPHTEQHNPEHKFLCMLSVVVICKHLQEAGLHTAVLNQESSDRSSKPKTSEKSSDELSPELKTVAEAMLRHVLQLQCNAQAITVMQELGPGDGAVVNTKPVRLATALFPVLSLLNHSCCPNTSVSFCGTAATVRASQPIPRGQEIFHCYDQALRILLKCQMDAGNFLSPEHLLMGEMEDHLAQVYATLGKWQEAARHLKKSIEIVEIHHGPTSEEIGHELFKLAQILFNGFAVSEALSTIQRAEEILSMHCGPQSAQIQELQEMKTCLSELPRSIFQRT